MDMLGGKLQDALQSECVLLHYLDLAAEFPVLPLWSPPTVTKVLKAFSFGLEHIVVILARKNSRSQGPPKLRVIMMMRYS